jgi:hypothetical protein
VFEARAHDALLVDQQLLFALNHLAVELMLPGRSSIVRAADEAQTAAESSMRLAYPPKSLESRAHRHCQLRHADLVLVTVDYASKFC